MKFTAAMCVVLAVVAVALARRAIISPEVIWALLVILAGTLVLCAFQPRLFRGVYRAGMTAAFYIGQFVGRILLTLLFLLVVTPLGLLLRLMGKDLLKLKRDRSVPTYWEPVKKSQSLDRQF